LTLQAADLSRQKDVLRRLFQIHLKALAALSAGLHVTFSPCDAFPFLFGRVVHRTARHGYASDKSDAKEECHKDKRGE
jgi:hypothetical protein